MTSAVVRKLVLADAEGAIDVLVRAFETDPFVRWFVRSDARRADGMRAFFEIAIHQLTLPSGECFVTDAVEGAALWNPPGTWSLGLFDKLRLMPEFARCCGASRLIRVFMKTNPITAVHPREPHWYLFVLGVDPSAQGRGLGRALVAPVLERCDREQVPAYLETSKEENLGFYTSLGFAVTGEHRIPDGPPVWFLRRAPAPT